MKKFLIAMIFFMTACQPSYHVEITGSNDMGPVFCISHTKKCGSDDGVYLVILEIDLMDDETGGTEETVWAIACRDDSSPEHKKCRIKELAYGQVPDGWIERVKAKPVLASRYYTVPTKLKYFIKNENDEYRILDSYTAQRVAR